jgi:glycolate oxidase iron-sulfur subunit
MLELARAAIRSDEPKPRFATWLERSVLRHLVPHPKRLSLLVALMGWVQRIGLDRMVVGSLPERIRSMHALLPEIPEAAQRRRMPSFTPAIGERRGRVALLEGCVMPEFFGRVNEAARLVLSRSGYDVIVPESQGCCGALQAHGGDLDFARSLARTNVAAFADETLDAIVVTSAGCSAAMHDAAHWLGPDGLSMANRTRDVLQFLDEAGSRLSFEPLPLRVCYDDPCHLIHAQGIAAAPRRLLQRIPDLELVAHRNPEACCGAAGIYNLTHPEMSRQVLSPKLDALIEAAPEIVATANPGCAMQLEAGLAGRGHSAEVVHPIELLERASRAFAAPAEGARV